MSSLGVSFAKMFYAFSGSDKQRLVLHLDPGSISLSELVHAKKKPIVRVIERHLFAEDIDPSDLNPRIVELESVLSSIVERYDLSGRDVIITSNLRDMKVQMVSAFYLTPKELKVEAAEIEFWREHIADLGALENPVINYKVVSSDPVADQTLLLAAACPRDILLQLTELVSEASLNPIAIVPEPLAIVNSVFHTTSRADRRASMAIVYLSESGGRVIGFASNQLADVTFEFNELDRILIKQLEGIDDAGGQFWTEVGSRVGSSIQQSIDYLIQEEKFIPFRKIVLISGLADPAKIRSLLIKTSDIKSIEVWSGAEVLGVNEGDSPNAAESLFAPSVGAHHSALDAEVTGAPLGEVFSDLSMHPFAKKIRANRRIRGANAFFGVVMALCLVASAVFTGLITGPEYLRAKDLAAEAPRVLALQRSANQSLQGVQGQISQLNQQSEMLRQVATQNTRYEFFDLFPETVPNGVGLTEFGLDRQGTLRIKGISESADLVTLFTDNLVKEKLMRSPKVSAAMETGQQGEQTGFKFEIYGVTGQSK
jgi:Tfp pilus assembly protein PilN